MSGCRRRLARRTYLAASLLVATICVASSSVVMAIAAHAQTQAVQQVVIPLNKSVTITVPKAFSSSVIDQPDIVTARPLTTQKLLIQAKRLGTTDVSIYDENMDLLKVVNVEVAPDTGNLQSKIWASTGYRGIRVTSDNGSIVLSGTVPDAVTADRAFNLAKSWVAGAATGGPQGAANVINAMNIASPQEVSLKVRFLEVSRNAGRELGINWTGTNASGTRGASTGLGGLRSPAPQNCAPTCPPPGNGIFQAVGTLVGANVGAPFGTVLAEVVNNGVQIDTLVTALETKGLLQRLAEPNLVALSGDTASFQAGGQFPVPVAVSSGIGVATPTIEFKDFGVILRFRPTVLNGGIINLSLSPEVSELDFTNAVSISGTTIPSVIRRTATTTVELRDGQSFAIAGLLQAHNSRNISQLPWIGSVPVLGTLFRSTAYQKDETDLVIIVTPTLVRPAAPGARLATPFDNTVPSNDVDLFLMGQMEQRKKYTEWVTSGGDIQGPYGYMLGVMQGPDYSRVHK
jgi:pilus assembly protein CpaC